MRNLSKSHDRKTSRIYATIDRVDTSMNAIIATVINVAGNLRVKLYARTSALANEQAAADRTAAKIEALLS